MHILYTFMNIQNDPHLIYIHTFIINIQKQNSSACKMLIWLYFHQSRGTKIGRSVNYKIVTFMGQMRHTVHVIVNMKSQI